MHKLLSRLTRKHFDGEVPDAMAAFVKDIDEAFRAADSDRALLEHSMETVSEELGARYELIQHSLSQSRSAEHDLAKTLSLLSATLESTADGILVMDMQQTMIQMNRQFGSLWRLPVEILESRSGADALAFVLGQLEEPEAFLAKTREVNADKDAESFDILRFKDGRVFERYSKPQKVDGETIGRVWSFRDISERQALEAQLRQSQKLEAIGSLAGGVAHDFNNLLTVIQGHGDFLKQSLVGSHTDHEDVDTILRAVARATELTAQLLAFGRKQILKPVNIEINDVIAGVQPMLRRLIGEDIRIVIDPASEATTVLVDRGQMEQALLNLAVNARDAMPSGGELTIQTRVVSGEPEGTDSEWSARRSHGMVHLLVSDSGQGIPEEIRERIFEPFFTTKEVGRGTGLGLATVHGIVRQSGGHITVESEVGEGTTFIISFPRAAAGAPDSTTSVVKAAQNGGRETILIAEDEGAVRELARRILQRYGYTIIVASDAAEAMLVAASYPGRIDLLLSDVVMPEGGGRLLAEEIRTLRPAVKVVFMSGYTDDEIIRRGALDPSTSFLPKPFSGDGLAAIVRATLDRPGADEDLPYPQVA